jgi:NADPH-dependent glutamate synthase beta subunit-like oxidoreductase
MLAKLERFFKGISSLLVGLAITFRNFLRRPVTLQYPWHKWEVPPGYRGLLRVKAFFDRETIAKKTDYYRNIPRAPCMEGCPANTDVRGYITCVAEGKLKEGVRALLDTYPFPGSLGRVCPAPCEKVCNREMAHRAPLTVRWLKRYLADFNRGLPPEERVPLVTAPVEFKSKTVAIIGAGPAGITTAVELARRGYKSTIFESLPVPGGYLYIGIPAYRLPKDVLLDEVKAVTDLGIEIKYNTKIGKDMQFEEIAGKFDAVFIGAGAIKTMLMEVPGEDLEGVIPGEDFLMEVNLGREVKLGERVAVIGGGNTAIDCARVSKRLGADVAILYRRTRAEMPADPHEVHDCLEEAVDLQILITPVRIVGENGKVMGIECLRNELGEPDKSGRRRPVPIQGSEFMFKCDNVLTAISRSADLSWLPDDIKRTKWGTLDVKFDTGETSRKGVFGGGDVTLGAATVIEAIACGRRAARAIASYLDGKSGEAPSGR